VNPALTGLLVFGSLFLIACAGVRFGMGPASIAAHDRLADLDTDLDVDEPVPFVPVDVDPLSPGDHAWLRSYGITA
jgi:hypothetical protein